MDRSQPPVRNKKTFAWYLGVFSGMVLWAGAMALFVFCVYGLCVGIVELTR